mmetsp:Transcript_58975/g.171103  ORF Transcript_58975/g.171103 Transcript_58975/m.171103 type:complete len:472 (-) Transcript_58975:333-1748(-)
MEAIAILPLAGAAAAYRRWRPPTEAAWQYAGEAEQSAMAAVNNDRDGPRFAGRSVGRELLVAAKPSALSSLAGGACGASEVCEVEMDASPRECSVARKVLASFCGAWSALRVEPAGGELERLTRSCGGLAPEALAEALAEQLVAFGDGQAVDWRRHLRALHAANHMIEQGGAVEAALLSALSEAEPLLHHLASEVPQCQEQAVKALRLLRRCHAEADDFDEGSRAAPPRLPALLTWRGARRPGSAFSDEAALVSMQPPVKPSFMPCVGLVPHPSKPRAVDDGCSAVAVRCPVALAKRPGAQPPRPAPGDEATLGDVTPTVKISFGRLVAQAAVAGAVLASESASTGTCSEIDLLGSDLLSEDDGAAAIGSPAPLSPASVSAAAPPMLDLLLGDSPAERRNAAASPGVMSEAAPGASPSPSPDPTSATGAGDAEEQALGFHWLEASRLAWAVPEWQDPFAFARVDFEHLQGL